jgi:hypothetical protein
VKLPGDQLQAELREYWRQLGLPECVHCGSPNIQPSHPHWWERALSWPGLFPYRCGHCLRRSYLRARAPAAGNEE